MALGDLLTRDGQYEINGLLLNDSLADLDTLKVIKVSGLFSAPDMKVSDSEVQDDHGGQVGRDLFTMRTIVMDLLVIASTKANMYNKLKAIESAFQPQSDLLGLAYQRAGIGKQFVNVRPRKLGGFDTSDTLDKGWAEGSVMLLAPDPRKFDLVQRSQGIVIASAGTTNSGTLNMAGNFKGGARPILEIAGPATNPRIGNAADFGRSLKVDMVILAGQTLIVDFATRTLTMGGLDQSGNVRSDSQWWALYPGNNLISFTRSNTPAATSTLTVKWWDSYA